MNQSNYNSIKTILKCSLALTIFILISGCSGKFKTEISLVEGLSDTLIANHTNLQMDIALFGERTQEISATLLNFKNFYPEKMELELGNTLTRYKSIGKIYKKQIKIYEHNVKEQEELQVQLDNLMNDLQNKNLSKEEFKKYFNEERADIRTLVSSSKLIKKTLYELEPEYLRLRKVLLEEEKKIPRLGFTCRTKVHRWILRSTV